jgi:Tfp pilus assembly protein PilV
MLRAMGHTLVEVIVAKAILAVVLLGMAGMVSLSSKVDANSRQSTIVMARMESILSQIAADGIRGAQTRYAAPNNTFDVPPLTGVTVSGTVQKVGLIEFITDETAVNRDLNGDGAANNKNVGAAAVLLPVRLSAAWQDKFGTYKFTVMTYVSSY